MESEGAINLQTHSTQATPTPPALSDQAHARWSPYIIFLENPMETSSAAHYKKTQSEIATSAMGFRCKEIQKDSPDCGRLWPLFC